MRRWAVVVGAGILALLIAAPASAGNRDYADFARNIIPSGQWGSIPPPPGADEQALMYDALTPLFDDVKPADLNRYFKSEKFGVGPDGPATPESVPRPGVTVVRDRFNVPHIRSESYDGAIWAAGWFVAKDRALLLEQARYNARVAAIDAPGLTALRLITGLRSFRPSEQTEAEIAKQTAVLESAGREGRLVLHDIDTFISGINDYLEASGSSNAPWTRNDVYAVNALKGQFLGQGGGDEARRSMFLAGLQERLGERKGMSVFNDLRQFKNPGLHASVDGRFNYGEIPKNAKGSVVLDPGSFERTPAAPNAPRAAARRQLPAANEASNILMIHGSRSETGLPLMVGGPQIGHFYPGLTGEGDVKAPGLVWRGATSVPFPGYLLIGRGRDFANMLTSAGGDIIDQYAETLCGGGDEMYVYKGECRPMERFDAGTLDGEPVSFLRTVHGPVVGYATVDGRRVAISSKRSSYGKDVLDQLFFRRLSTGEVTDPKSFFKAAALTPQTFNAFYSDNKHIAEYTTGLLPQRAKGVDPGLPTVGTGEYEWRGFLADKRHPHGTDPRDGTIVNWNEGAARGFGAADDDWAKNGSVSRHSLLYYNLKRLRGDDGWSAAEVVSAMNAAATQDVRAIKTVPLLQKLLRGSQPPTGPAGEMLAVMVDWREAGGSRLDRDLDGLIDHPGAASMDAAWPKIADAFMAPKLGPQLGELNSLHTRFALPPDQQRQGWYQYFDRDVRNLLGMPVEKPFQNHYCGKGKLRACQSAIWGALAEAGAELTAAQGTADPSQWHSDATRERIRFAPINLATIRYSNRPTGIQQVISFKRGQD